MDNMKNKSIKFKVDIKEGVFEAEVEIPDFLKDKSKENIEKYTKMMALQSLTSHFEKDIKIVYS